MRPVQGSEAVTMREPANGLVATALVSALVMTGFTPWSGRWTPFAILAAVLICGLPWLATVLLIYRKPLLAGVIHLIGGIFWIAFGLFSFAWFLLFPLGAFFVILGCVEMFL